ncbi:MAG: acyloxyacyl hydrolase [Cytophagaceae bacterium]
MNIRQVYFSALLIFLLTPAFAQEDATTHPSGYMVNFNLMKGTILDHSLNMSHLTDQSPTAFELDFSKQTYGNKDWQQLYNFPQIGFALHYVLLDPQRPLGNFFSAATYISPVLYRSEKNLLSYRIGIGIGYVERRFHPTLNPDNNLMSSRLNFCLYGNINFRRFLLGNTHINTGIGILHYSNGAFKVPNLGINIPTIHLGVGIGDQPQKSFKKGILPDYARKYYVNIIGAAGLKEMYPIEGPKYTNYSSSVYVSRTLNRKSMINAGIDVFYNNSYERHMENRYLTDKKYKATSALTIGHELVISKLVLLTQVGYYIYTPLPDFPYTDFYQRVSLRYYFMDNLSVGAALKTHYANADFVEYSIGYRF